MNSIIIQIIEVSSVLVFSVVGITLLVAWEDAKRGYDIMYKLGNKGSIVSAFVNLIKINVFNNGKKKKEE